tara:strand:- start:1689 stop:2702 length:1014 start_codon:yes stop_codon:yes gene_type:complete
MPSKSKAQQKFMGAVYALKKGDLKPSDATPAVRKVAKDMKKSDAKDFASTKHKGLPKKVKQEIIKRLRDEGKVGYPQVGNYAIPSFPKKRKHGDTNNLGKRDKNNNSGQPDLEEGMFSTLDQIRKDSKNVRDFVKNVFADRDFKRMKNDKEFVKYLKSIYEGSFQRTSQMKGFHPPLGLNHHLLKKTVNPRKHDDDTNFPKKNSGQEEKDLEELSTKEKVELYSLYSKAMKSMPGSPKQKKIKQQINKIRVKNGMKPLKENTLNEIGVFPIQNYIKGIIPSSELQIMNDKDREKVKSLIKDLVFTLNDFWKSHKIPFRVREPRPSDMRRFKNKNKRY